MPYINPLTEKRKKIHAVDVLIWSLIVGFFLVTASVTMNELMMAIVAVGFPIIIVLSIFKVLKK